MKKVLWLVVIGLLFAGLAEAKEYLVNKKAGNLEATIRIDKNPPIVGTNNMEISLKDASGKEVTDARVTVEYGMPAMPGMPAMNYRTDARLQGAKYRAALTLSMAGSWNVTVKINRQGKPASAKFTVDAR